MSNPCNNCPLRLFNNKCHNLKGVGNPIYGKIIVVPNVDYIAYKNKCMSFSKYVEIINDVLISSTGGIEDYFIIPLIRCNITDKCPLTEDIVNKCLLHTIKDIRDNNAIKILLLGDAARYYLGVKDISAYTNTLFISKERNIRGYAVSYSPFTKYTNEAKYKEFCNDLVKWYNACKDNKYNGYEIKIL